ncbi:carboxymuconolactone decarboxylase family protein [Oligella sp. MSHR50489EDL]|uniref:carboxymuconolactone decarboxylase family protein n=1 Tax=Oligella sp. MSHR50489EDL TaxID=3139409 RepID=UPI003D8171C5
MKETTHGTEVRKQGNKPYFRKFEGLLQRSQAAIRLGMTKAELGELVGVAVMMGGGPTLMYGSHAVAAFKEFSEN